MYVIFHFIFKHFQFFQWFFKNFLVMMMPIGLITALSQIGFSKKAKLQKIDVLLRHQLFCTAGLGGIYGYMMYSFFQDSIAYLLGWKISPFQFQVAIAYLGLGVIGLIAFFANRGYQAATITILTCFFWGNVINYSWQMLGNYNYVLGPDRLIFNIDLYYPIILIVLFVLRARQSFLKTNG